MTMDHLYTFAAKHKANANKFFHEKNYCLAFRLYHRSLCYLLNFINEEPSSEHEPYLNKCNQLILSIYSNMAACQLIHDNHRHVIENCSAALQIDPMFVKALYRRAVAYAHVNDYELALKDLHLAKQLEPNDTKIDELLKQTKQRFEHYKKTLGNSLKNFFVSEKRNETDRID
jgi:tetratricopeptide (TPR) repeat protein